MSFFSPPEELVLAGHRVRAVSVGGLETAIDLPGLSLAFDVGRCPPWLVRRRTILFTHSHIDHMGGVAQHVATRALLGMDAPTYVVPRESLESLRRLLAAWRELDGSELQPDLVPVAPGDEVALPARRRARVFRSPHTAPCQGYAVVETKRKLKSEYRGAAPEEIRRLRVEEGVQVTDDVESVEVAFVGDSRIEVVEREPDVRAARLLVLEVTFLDDRVGVEDARSMGHIHLDEVIERADLFQNEALLFTHFSARYRRSEIEAILASRLPPELAERVTPLVAAHGR